VIFNSFPVRLLFACVIGRIACIFLILWDSDPFLAFLLEIPKEKLSNDFSYLVLDITTYSATLMARGRFFYILLFLPFLGIIT
jgi:hypothetical protein